MRHLLRSFKLYLVTLPFPEPPAVCTVLATVTTNPEPEPKMLSQMVSVLFLWLSILYSQSRQFSSPGLQQLLHECELLLQLHSR